MTPPVAVGVGLLLATTAAVGYAGWRIARRFWCDEVEEVLLGSVVASTALAVMVLQVLGLTGLLYLPALLGAVAITCGYAWLWTRSSPCPPLRIGPRLRAFARSTPALTLAGAAFGFGVLLLGVLLAVDAPRPQFDSYSRYLPIAVRWLQTGDITGLPGLTPDQFGTTYPGNTELISVWLLLPLHRDMLVQLAPLPGALMLLGGVALGARELGASRFVAWCAGLLSVTVPFCVQDLLATNLSDLQTIGGVAAAAGFLARAQRRDRRLALGFSGASAGLAAGSHGTALLALLPLIGVFLVQESRRRVALRTRFTDAAPAVALVVVLAGYWYVRNTVYTGDPIYPTSVPWRDVQIAHFEAANVPSFLSLGFAPHKWVTSLWSLMRHGGPIGLLLVAGSVLPLLLRARARERDPVRWAWALWPLAELVLFVAMPYGTDLPFNLRFLLPTALATASIGAVELTAASSRRAAPVAAGITGIGGLATVVLIDPHPRTALVGLAIAVTGVIVLAFRIWVPRIPSPVVPAAVVTGAALAVIVSPLAWHHWLAHRLEYRLVTAEITPRLGKSDATVDVVGFCEVYGLYDENLNRHVVQVTAAKNGHAVEDTDPGTFKAWLARLYARDVDTVVVATDACSGSTAPTERRWIMTHPEVFLGPARVTQNQLIYRLAPHGGARPSARP